MMNSLAALAAAVMVAAPAFACDCNPSWVKKASSFDAAVRLEEETAAEHGRLPLLAVLEAEVVGLEEVVVGQYPAPSNAPRTERRLRLAVRSVARRGPGGEPLAPEISILDQSGMCGARLDGFEAGKRYAFALQPRQERSLFILNGCGVYFKALP